MNGKSFQIIQTSKKGVSIFWWIFWLIVFWPFLAFVAVVHEYIEKLEAYDNRPYYG